MLHLVIGSPTETLLAVAYDWMLSLVVIGLYLGSQVIMNRFFDAIFGKGVERKEVGKTI